MLQTITIKITDSLLFSLSISAFEALLMLI